MTRFWIVTANVYTSKDGWTGTRQIPTFLLDGNIQGITGQQHACNVVLDILRSIDPDAHYAFRVDPMEYL